MIKSEEEYHKIYFLLLAMEDMSWLSSNVRDSMEGLEYLTEARAIEKALDIIRDSYTVLNESVSQWEENN